MKVKIACLCDGKLLPASRHYGDTVCGSQKVGTGQYSEELPVETGRNGVKLCVFVDVGVVQAELAPRTCIWLSCGTLDGSFCFLTMSTNMR